MEEIYVPYLPAYPNIEKALKDGAKMHCFLSGGSLRVVFVKDDNEKNLTYGEHPYFSGALAHAESDFGLTYDEQYGGENAKHNHYLSGHYPLNHDALDIFVKSGKALDIFYSDFWKSFVCYYPAELEGRICWGSSSTILTAIVDCLLFGYSHEVEKDSFLSKVAAKTE